MCESRSTDLLSQRRIVAVSHHLFHISPVVWQILMSHAQSASQDNIVKVWMNVITSFTFENTRTSSKQQNDDHVCRHDVYFSVESTRVGRHDDFFAIDENKKNRCSKRSVIDSDDLSVILICSVVWLSFIEWLMMVFAMKKHYHVKYRQSQSYITTCPQLSDRCSTNHRQMCVQINFS